MTDVLSGIRVVELAAWTFVPAAGAVLADWGADVIKVEHPETGDPQRGLINSGIVAGAGGVNHFVEQPNRGKRSIGLDTSSPEGREVLMKLIESADVFLTNLLPDSRRRMGIDVDQVRARNPKIIYARGHGYGTKGEAANQGGFDLAAYWARGGIGDGYAATDGSYPPLQLPAFGDVYGGLTIAAGIAGALVKRERTGEPSVVDVSLLSAAIWQLGPNIVGAGVTGRDVPKFSLEEMPNPAVNLYKTRDGRFIAFVLLQADRFWSDFCARLGRPDLTSDDRFATAPKRFENRRECIAELRAIFATEDLAHWEKSFAGFEGVWDVMRTAHEIHADPQVIANGYLPRTTDANGNEFALAGSPVQFDETPLELTCAPGHGEHTDEVLAELGYDEDQIIDLKIKSVLL
ncbi:CoA transferase [Mycolicibacterium anyangense]|jgi:crotonobetainyl-CoA:carnitine CoA-transferase CaiB-like acyl-CoA transferase|uniref:CoA transferase n=1 Tax=Mycolicibacterium anyangense TaxID=1431246 RepID=A0A6N4W9Y8_9MYCO|nr:CaiB/BaiF CoA-transferase family protein [Mycolicibacterium anyangense]BBZ78796.1 CoA transferase [Mycolicibacterium anyangense]